MELKQGCRPAYTVASATPFVFNIESQNRSAQHVQSETLKLTPDLAVERWTMPESGNRHFRVNAPDPTRKADPAGIVRIGLGRDAAEVAFCSPYGAIDFEKPEVWIEQVGERVESTTKAVRLLDE